VRSEASVKIESFDDRGYTSHSPCRDWKAKARTR
jgi:hypothetical protein